MSTNHEDHFRKTMRSLLRQPDIELDTPLHNVARNGNIEIFRYGWTTEERDYRGQTPLHFAAEEDNTLLVKALLFKNANLEARDEKGYTPLLAAASRGSLEVVKLLHERALITALSFYGETILGTFAVL